MAEVFENKDACQKVSVRALDIHGVKENKRTKIQNLIKQRE